jgi:hypothetical protein
MQQKDMSGVKIEACSLNMKAVSASQATNQLMEMTSG